MVKFTLHTWTRDHGKIKIDGREDGEMIIFDHPTEEESIVLQVTRERAMEICSMDRHTQSRLNLRIEKYEVHLAREYEREPLQTFKCPHCGEAVTWIDSDFVLHTIPSCEGWKKEHP